MDEQMLLFEQELYNNGIDLIAGCDEVGRGPLAGPVVACAVILPRDFSLHPLLMEVNDSKKLSEKKRAKLCPMIQEACIDYGIGVVSQERIDEVNILNATFEAMAMAIAQLKTKPDYVLADGNMLIPNLDIPQRAIVSGDSKSASIACASIIAKVYRDSLMCGLSEAFPQYAFEKNKGYGTKAHVEALKAYGHCCLHRKSFLKKIFNLPEGNNRHE